MRLFRAIPPGIKLLLFTYMLPLLVMGIGVSPLSCVAQEAEDDSPQPPPPPAVFQDRIAANQLAFLNDYSGRPAKDALRDKRMRSLLKLVIPRTEYHYGRDMPLSDASDTVLSGTSLPVEIRAGRYVTVGTRGGEYLNGRGFLWFDLQEGIALGGVYFHPVNGEPTPTLAIFSRQLTQTSLSMSQLPLAFAEDMGAWAAEASIPPVSTRYFIPENGKKYVLVHDEDFCDAPANAPAPAQGVCQQLNADAADADLNAAYFMKQTHNAANATAWTLNPELITWIGVRNQGCGLGPAALGCRIRLTRRRTGIVIGRHS